MGKINNIMKNDTYTTYTVVATCDNCNTLNLHTSIVNYINDNISKYMHLIINCKIIMYILSILEFLFSLSALFLKYSTLPHSVASIICIAGVCLCAFNLIITKWVITNTIKQLTRKTISAGITNIISAHRIYLNLDLDKDDFNDIINYYTSIMDRDIEDLF